MASTTDGRSQLDMQIVDDFANSFQACFALVTNQNSNQIHEPEEVKTSVEQTIQRFLDNAKQLECFFLQKRLYLSVHKPEQMIAEEINDLKAEIQRKDLAMQRYQEKIIQWQAILNDPPAPTMVQPVHGPPMIQGQAPPGIRPGMPPGPHPQMRPGGPSIPQQQMHGPHMGPGGFMPGAPGSQPQPSNLQGPLAFLERTTSNIGMGEQRR